MTSFFESVLIPTKGSWYLSHQQKDPNNIKKMINDSNFEIQTETRFSQGKFKTFWLPSLYANSVYYLIKEIRVG